jgi:hypothetical protein
MSIFENFAVKNPLSDKNITIPIDEKDQAYIKAKCLGYNIDQEECYVFGTYAAYLFAKVNDIDLTWEPKTFDVVTFDSTMKKNTGHVEKKPQLESQAVQVTITTTSGTLVDLLNKLALNQYKIAFNFHNPTEFYTTFQCMYSLSSRIVNIPWYFGEEYSLSSHDNLESPLDSVVVSPQQVTLSQIQTALKRSEFFIYNEIGGLSSDSDEENEDSIVHQCCACTRAASSSNKKIEDALSTVIAYPVETEEDEWTFTYGRVDEGCSEFLHKVFQGFIPSIDSGIAIWRHILTLSEEEQFQFIKDVCTMIKYDLDQEGTTFTEVLEKSLTSLEGLINPQIRQMNLEQTFKLYFPLVKSYVY